jgi:lipid A disaccharide synthetase
MKIKKFALPNLLTTTPRVSEYIQDDATVDAISTEISMLLHNGLSDPQYKEYMEVHQSLRLGGGEKAVEVLTEHFKL